MVLDFAAETKVGENPATELNPIPGISADDFLQTDEQLPIKHEYDYAPLAGNNPIWEAEDEEEEENSALGSHRPNSYRELIREETRAREHRNRARWVKEDRGDHATRANQSDRYNNEDSGEPYHNWTIAQREAREREEKASFEESAKKYMRGENPEKELTPYLKPSYSYPTQEQKDLLQREQDNLEDWVMQYRAEKKAWGGRESKKDNIHEKLGTVMARALMGEQYVPQEVSDIEKVKGKKKRLVKKLVQKAIAMSRKEGQELSDPKERKKYDDSNKHWMRDDEKGGQKLLREIGKDLPDSWMDNEDLEALNWWKSEENDVNKGTEFVPNDRSKSYSRPPVLQTVEKNQEKPQAEVPKRQVSDSNPEPGNSSRVRGAASIWSTLS